MLENLISNALKVTGAGNTVTVRALRKDREILFTVADTGAGIPAEDLPHVFDRYFRGRAAHGFGLGLGLPIARAIVEGHGSHIWAESVLGKGSTFFVTFPLDARVAR